jgi:ABC-type multidrug transport system ATPase subunit
MSSFSHAPSHLHVTALSGGPGNLPLIQNLTHAWSAGVHWICGDEGTGKTTLLRLLAGDLPTMTGSVSRPEGGVFWVDLQGAAHDQVLVQDCWDAMRKNCPRWHEELLQQLISDLDMDQHRHKRLNMLSTGSRRKVMVIGALASGATVTLLDQPFVSLDLASIQTIQDFLSEAAEHPQRAWIVADYEVPAGWPHRGVLDLDSRSGHRSVGEESGT